MSKLFNKFTNRKYSPSPEDIGAAEPLETLESLNAELKCAQDDLLATESKLSDLGTPTSGLEMEYDMGVHKIAVIESKLKKFSASSVRNESDSEDETPLEIRKFQPERIETLHNRQLEPELYYLEQAGYDSFIFKNISFHGRLKLKDEETEKFNTVYVIISDYTYQGLYVFDYNHTKENKKIKKNAYLKPLLVIRFKGSFLKLLSDPKQFSICIRRPITKNAYGDQLDYVVVNKREMIEYTFETMGNNVPQFSNQNTNVEGSWTHQIQNAISSGTHVQSLLRVVHSLTLLIKTATLAKELNNGEGFIRIFFAGEERGQTKLVKAVKGECNWMQTFTFDDIPSNIEEITMEIVLKRALKKASVLGKLTVNSTTLRQLSAKSTFGDWFDFRDTNDANCGRVLLSTSFSFSRILPLQSYQALSEKLLTMVSSKEKEKKANIQELLQVLKSTEVFVKASLGTCLTRYFMSQRTHVEFLSTLAELEIENCEGIKTLFRSNSILTKSLDFFINFVGNHYLKGILGEITNEISQGSWNIEVDPLIVTSKSQLAKNFDKLFELTTIILERIFQSVNDCPIEVRQVLARIKTAASARFKSIEDEVEDFDGQILQSVSAFFFLRFISAALMSPSIEPFYLTEDIPQAASKRTLTLVSKIMQKLSNLCQFTQSESYLMPVNDFLNTRSYYTKMRYFLHQVSKVPDFNTQDFDYTYEIDVARTLSQTYRCFADIELSGVTNPFLLAILDTLPRDHVRMIPASTRTRRSQSISGGNFSTSSSSPSPLGSPTQFSTEEFRKDERKFKFRGSQKVVTKKLSTTDNMNNKLHSLSNPILIDSPPHQKRNHSVDSSFSVNDDSKKRTLHFGGDQSFSDGETKNYDTQTHGQTSTHGLAQSHPENQGSNQDRPLSGPGKLMRGPSLKKNLNFQKQLQSLRKGSSKSKATGKEKDSSSEQNQKSEAGVLTDSDDNAVSDKERDNKQLQRDKRNSTGSSRYMTKNLTKNYSDNTTGDEDKFSTTPIKKSSSSSAIEFRSKGRPTLDLPTPPSEKFTMDKITDDEEPENHNQPDLKNDHPDIEKNNDKNASDNSDGHCNKNENDNENSEIGLHEEKDISNNDNVKKSNDDHDDDGNNNNNINIGNSDNGNNDINKNNNNDENNDNYSDGHPKVSKKPTAEYMRSAKDDYMQKSVRELKELLSALSSMQGTTPRHCLTKQDLVDEIVRIVDL